MTEWIGGKPKLTKDATPPSDEETAREKAWHRSATQLQMLIGFLALVISLVASGLSFSNHLAVNDLRLANLEKKTTEYDALVTQRTAQFNTINTALATLAAQSQAQSETLKEMREDLRAQKGH